MNPETHNCQNCKNDFAIEPDDFGFYEKMGVPAPTFCPKCRRTRRLAWLNDFVLYNRECFMCSKKFISIYAQNNASEVMCPKCFFGDKFNPEDYGIEYDPTKSFFEQFNNLLKSIPKLGIVNDEGIGSVNCLYNNDIAFSKNSAMCFVAWRMENCLYSMYINVAKDVCDCHCINEMSEFTYEGVVIDSVARSKYIYWSASCTDCFFGYDLRGCTDCFMCVGLRNKQHYFKNKKYTREEYNKIIESYKLETRSGAKKAKEEFADFIKDHPRKFADLRNCVNCTGAEMVRSKNTHDSKYAAFSEDSRYSHNGVTFKSCYDCAGGAETELAYECVTPDQSYNSLATIKSWKNRNISYCIDCHSCEEVFGCVGVKTGKYVILNKRYSKEEYFKLKEQIIEDMKNRGEYGEFFPAKYALCGINETRAIEQLDILKEEATEKGYHWQDELQQTRGKETIKQVDIPDSIEDVPDTITSEILACVECERNYKILPDEFTFYKRLKIPIPEACFFCRYAKREAMRGSFDLVNRQCDCSQESHEHEGYCNNTFETFFTNQESRPVYCESCYQKEVV